MGVASHRFAPCFFCFLATDGFSFIRLFQVWMSGVTVTFEEHLMTVDSDTGELVGALEAQVATGQFIT